jgi:hypothetical protein
MIEPVQPETISQVLGLYGPIDNVRTNWPFVEAALEKHSIDDLPTRIACLATIAVETGCFSPIKERGGPAYFKKMYETNEHVAKMLGNSEPGDGARFRGRGFVQITGRANYANYGRAIGVDLVSNPDLALDPKIAAEILALYFRDHKIPALAAAGKWESVRRKVNGGLNGWARFLSYVQGLSQALTPSTPVDTAAIAVAENKPVEAIGVGDNSISGETDA